MNSALEQGLNEGRFGRLGRSGRGDVKGRVEIGVPLVRVGAAFDEESDDVERRKDADRVPPDGRAVAGAGQVEGRGSVPSAGSDSEEFVDRFFDPENLVLFKVRQKLGEKTNLKINVNCLY